MLVLVGLLCLTGAFFVLVSGIGMFKARDGLSRVNVLSAATGLGMPLLATGVYLRTVQVEGFLWLDLLKLVIAVLGFVIPGIAWQAHLGGLLVGAACAAVVAHTGRRPAGAGPTQRASFGVHWVGLGAIAVALVGLTAATLRDLHH